MLKSKWEICMWYNLYLKRWRMVISCNCNWFTLKKSCWLEYEWYDESITSLKQELVYNKYFYTKKQAKKEIFEYIKFYYNRVKSHSYLGNLSPVKFEEKQKMLQNAMVD